MQHTWCGQPHDDRTVVVCPLLIRDVCIIVRRGPDLGGGLEGSDSERPSSHDAEEQHICDGWMDTIHYIAMGHR